MTGTVLTVLLGVLVVIAISALTGYFVAQEFGFMAVDRSRLRAAAAGGDVGARRALEVTKRTSFMLSGAQLGITVTGLVVGYVAEPMIGEGVGELLGVAGVPTGVGVVVGTVAALLLATVVQMVMGELFPKNLAIARPDEVARALALSTLIYLKVLGWLIRVFDAASNLLLRAVRIEPVHDVEHAATPRDLEAIIDESREQGELPAGLSTLLDRVLDFTDRTAREAMIPRPRVDTVVADLPLADLVARMAHGHSRYPVTGDGVDDVVGIVHLRDVLALTPAGTHRTARDVMRPPMFVPESLPLTALLEQLRGSGDELACVLDEYGGLAGVITAEDVAEELVGEITDEHDPAGVDTGPTARRDGWQVAGAMHVDEVERVIDHDLPHGDYTTIGGLLTSCLGRLPEPGDTVELALRGATDEPERVLVLTVRTVARRVAETIELRWSDHEPARGGGTEGSPS
ncbi:hemolysin family protein [Pseudonocardia lacus]|uniref:hemolysin family protein n=1 Tax=Pseudonocardia lacus TaxID=2835865 RepID=UPI001BDD2630|nr:hemolysin family protein [Pseudonocardia lacus]